ncbi:hypothetical protein MTBUT4_30219 [Magnetospirillum sp. UT-4]|nr:hypothetical protein MTBUT4_30219 [Magnetospirillum sp. UT-4]
MYAKGMSREMPHQPPGEHGGHALGWGVGGWTLTQNLPPHIRRYKNRTLGVRPVSC